MVALCNRETIYIFLSPSIFFFSSPILSRRRLDVYDTSTHGVVIARIQNADLKRTTRGAARWNCRTQKIAKNSPSRQHRTNLSRYIFAAKARIDNRKTLLNNNVSSTCSHNMVNFGPLAAEICWRVWGTPANFNRFRVLAGLLHGTLVVGVSQTLRR